MQRLGTAQGQGIVGDGYRGDGFLWNRLDYEDVVSHPDSACNRMEQEDA